VLVAGDLVVDVVGAACSVCSLSLTSDNGSPNSSVRRSFVDAGWIGRMGRIGRVGLFWCRGGSGVAIRAASFLAWLPDKRCISVPTWGGRVSDRMIVPGTGVRDCPGGAFLTGTVVLVADGRGLAWRCMTLLQSSSNSGSVPSSRADVVNSASSSLSISGFGKLSAPGGTGDGLLYRYRFPFPRGIRDSSIAQSPCPRYDLCYCLARAPLVSDLGRVRVGATSPFRPGDLRLPGRGFGVLRVVL